MRLDKAVSLAGLTRSEAKTTIAASEISRILEPNSRQKIEIRRMPSAATPPM